MPFKSEKQRKWMYANDPEMAKKWEKEEAIREKLRNVIRQEIKSVFEKESINEGWGKYHLGGLVDYSGVGDSKLRKRLERTIRRIGGKIDAVGDDYIKFRVSGMDIKKLPPVIKKLDRKKIVWIGDKRKKSIWDRRKHIDKLGEGFGGELKGKDLEEFEKQRKENAEVLGYKVTGVSDIKEIILNEKKWDITQRTDNGEDFKSSIATIARDLEKKVAIYKNRHKVDKEEMKYYMNRWMDGVHKKLKSDGVL